MPADFLGEKMKGSSVVVPDQQTDRWSFSQESQCLATLIWSAKHTQVRVALLHQAFAAGNIRLSAVCENCDAFWFVAAMDHGILHVRRRHESA